MDKLFYSIAEVAEMFNINNSTLHYWEKIDLIHPRKTDKGTRQYRLKDIETIRLIYYLTKEKGLNLAGVKRKLKENKDSVNPEEIVFRLRSVRDELIKLRAEFDILDTTNPGK